jgi:sensor histidine kinase YesM
LALDSFHQPGQGFRWRNLPVGLRSLPFYWNSRSFVLKLAGMKRLYLVSIHLGFWLLVMAIRLPMLTRVDDASSFLSVLFWSFTFHLIIFYLFYFFFSAMLLKKQVLRFIIFYILFIGIYSIPVAFAFVAGYMKLISLGFIKPMSEDNDHYKVYISILTSQSIYATTGTFFRLTIDWFRKSRRQEELEKQNITNELALLRSQINPHFLFNTLNNIHSFVYRDQDKTAFGIIKLSEIMRYMLYETNADRVSLEKEINYIENYIELQKLRLKDPKFVEFKIEGDISGKNIPPLLLISFVENAFKHGRKNAPAPGIAIILKIFENTLTFEAFNFIAKSSAELNEESGFGLKNLRRRLDLIYGKKYNLEISEDKEKYYVKLFIEKL